MKRRIFKNDIETLRVEGRAIMDSTLEQGKKLN